MDGFGDSMVDRVAKAIWDAENPYDGDPVAVTIHSADCLPVVGDDKGVPAARELCRVIARAAIEAMREPTDSMSVNGGLELEEQMFAQQGLVFDGAKAVFQRMMDVALSEAREG